MEFSSFSFPMFVTLLRRNLVPFIIPTSPPSPLHLQSTQHRKQSLGRIFRAEQLLLRRRLPELPRQAGLHRARMQAHGHGVRAVLHAQMVVQRLDELVDARFRGAVAEPAAARVVADGADARGHERQDRGVVQAVFGRQLGRFPREEGRQVFGQHHGGEEVELQRREGGVVGDLLRGALRDQHAGEEEAEPQVRALVARSVVVSLFAVGGEIGDGGFGLDVAVLHVESLVVLRRDAFEEARGGAGDVGAGGCDDWDGGCLQEMLDEG